MSKFLDDLIGYGALAVIGVVCLAIVIAEWTIIINAATWLYHVVQSLLAKLFAFGVQLQAQVIAQLGGAS